MTEQITRRSGNDVIVYDASVGSHIEAAMFTAAHWPGADVVPGYSGGRGDTLFVRHDGEDWVVKHYHRGGFVGRFLNDSFLYTGRSRVRSVAEWDVLRLATLQGLPVPRPVAAHYRHTGLVYTAGLITRRIPDVTPFSTRLASGPAPASIWRAVGRCVRQFHDAGFFHADLSTHNLQIDSSDRIWLLDWDRGRRLPPGQWRRANLDRLLRSCRKISAAGEAHFSAADWQSLLDGYAQAASVPSA